MRQASAKIPQWAAGFTVALLVIAAFAAGWYPLQKLEYMTYDLRSAMRQGAVSSPVVIVGIDDLSIQKAGGWPLPRGYAADLIRKLKGYGAKTIGAEILYSESDTDNNRGLLAIRQIRDKIAQDPASQKDARLLEISKALTEAERLLSSSYAFAAALESSKNVILPLQFQLSGNAAAPTQLPAFMGKNSISTTAKGAFPAASGVVMPAEEFAGKAAGLGAANIMPDSDGIVRRAPTLIAYNGRLFPSFALRTALDYLGSGINGLIVDGGIRAGKLTIPIDNSGRMLISYSSKSANVPSYSLPDVMGDKIPAATFKDKIVLIGLTGAGRGAASATPLQGSANNLEITASAIENIINKNHVVRPWWLMYVELVIIALFGGIAVLPLRGALFRAVVPTAILIIWCALCIYLFYAQGIWVKMTYPVIVLILGQAAVLLTGGVRSGKMPKNELKLDGGIALGLTLQAKGQLDAAFEKFRECPLNDDSIKEHLYCLGQDFEVKGMTDKALAVYEHILSAGDYMGLAAKVKKFQTGGQKAQQPVPEQETATVLMQSADMAKFTLGRYEVIKELGRGAMGVVFLGRDPKINRDVAIKTLSYEDVDSEQCSEIKTRFFREAEAAGRLSHPNIVRVYDVGEDKDTAYMAMEMLDGVDLIKHCTKGALLPFGEVLKLVTRVGEALDYAHSNGVVHRDIKPANIMLLQNKEIRVTDFGIARVMESSKTQTGMVLGTPSYMSPEQIAGRKVDGRSDLFSLGVVFFELLTGERPFKGDTIATLMYNITSTPPTPIKKVEPRMPACIVEIIDKLLQKNADDRYSRGQDFVEALNRCKKSLIKRPAVPPQAATH